MTNMIDINGGLKNNLQTFVDGRTVKNIEFIVEGSEAYQAFVARLRPLEFRVVDAVMSNGGFIAGGLVRYVHEALALTGKFTDVDMDAYRQFGDIDFFFPNQETFRAAYASIRAGDVAKALLDNEEINLSASEGGFAYDIVLTESPKVNTAKFHYGPCEVRPIRMQLVTCRFDDVKTTLRRFDFFNSMLAFTKVEGRVRSIVPVGWRENELTNTLRVLEWQSPLTFYRIHKYTSKYGYVNISCGEGRTFEDVMDDISKTMQSLPYNPDDYRGSTFIRSRKRGTSDNGDLIFTQQNYAFHIQRFVQEKGFLFPEAFAVFAASLCMATDIATEHQAADLVKHTDLIRRNWKPEKAEKRVESWKRSREEAIKQSLEKKARNQEIYEFTTDGYGVCADLE